MPLIRPRPKWQPGAITVTETSWLRHDEPIEKLASEALLNGQLAFYYE